MACALALQLAKTKREIRLYSIEDDVTDEMRRVRRNTKYLPGHQFPEHVSATPDIVAAVNQADAVFIAVPSFAVAEVIAKARPHLSEDAIIASISKGLDPKTLEPLVSLEARLLPAKMRRRICSIGGPAVATEMAKGSPTAIVIASHDKSSANKIKKLLEGPAVKVATSRDVKGVGLAAALKNAYAIALGLCDGLQYPTNAKALVCTLAINEMAMILKKAGAHPDTAFGLAGLGDLIVTGMSPHGRNRTFGEKLVGAKSKKPTDLGLITVEGISATELASKLVKHLRLAAPLLSAIDRCLRASKDFEQPFVAYLKKLSLS